MAVAQAMCNSFKSEILQAFHNFGTTVTRAGTGADTFNIALYDFSTGAIGAGTTAYTSASVPAGQVTGTGYTSGGKALTISAAPQLSGSVAILNFSDVTWTAATITAGGALIYNATQSNRAVCSLSFGQNYTSTAGDFKITFPTFDSANAIIRIS